VKRCTRCGIEKHRDCFSADDKTSSGLRSLCRACDAARKRTRRQLARLARPDEVIVQQLIHEIWRNDFSLGYA